MAAQLPASGLTAQELHALYRQGATPTQVFTEVLARVARSPPSVWISLDDRQVLARAKELDALLQQGPGVLAARPLFGLPFAAKDNIDVRGFATTAGCPTYKYQPSKSAFAVDLLEKAGAICVGKANLDQFATGLVGVRSPYGVPPNTIDPNYVPGGSSCGSAVAVASRQVTFSLGTDTAGSGRVPAAFNELVGLKPSKPLVSATGVVPAVQSLDCISVFAHSVDDAEQVLEAFRGVDPEDPYTAAPVERPVATHSLRFGVPRWDQLEFCGDTARANAFKAHLQIIAESRQLSEFDFEPFQKVAALLYEGPWVAARTYAVGDFIEKHADDPAVDPTVKKIVMGGTKLSAVDVFRGLESLKRLERATEPAWRTMDVMVVPSTPSMFTLEQVKQEPIKFNSLLGTYTNFVNLLGLCALTLPAGRLPNGLPASITLIAPGFDDALLAQVGRWWESVQRDRKSSRL